MEKKDESSKHPLGIMRAAEGCRVEGLVELPAVADGDDPGFVDNGFLRAALAWLLICKLNNLILCKFTSREKWRFFHATYPLIHFS